MHPTADKHGIEHARFYEELREAARKCTRYFEIVARELRDVSTLEEIMKLL